MLLRGAVLAFNPDRWLVAAESANNLADETLFVDCPEDGLATEVMGFIAFEEVLLPTGGVKSGACIFCVL